MLPIGEDLGNIPDGVRPCLCDLGICGTKVMRWERRWKHNYTSFLCQRIHATKHDNRLHS